MSDVHDDIPEDEGAELLPEEDEEVVEKDISDLYMLKSADEMAIAKAQTGAATGTISALYDMAVRLQGYQGDANPQVALLCEEIAHTLRILDKEMTAGWMEFAMAHVRAIEDLDEQMAQIKAFEHLISTRKNYLYLDIAERNQAAEYEAKCNQITDQLESGILTAKEAIHAYKSLTGK